MYQKLPLKEQDELDRGAYQNTADPRTYRYLKLRFAVLVIVGIAAALHIFSFVAERISSAKDFDRRVRLDDPGWNKAPQTFVDTFGKEEGEINYDITLGKDNALQVKRRIPKDDPWKRVFKHKMLHDSKFDGESAISVKELKSGEKVYTHALFPRHKLRLHSVALPHTLDKQGICDPEVVQYTGYLDVDDNKHFFFWFFESRRSPSTDPFVLWLNGGPGCSSLTGLFMELGPCSVNKDGKTTTRNPYSWTNVSSMVFLDQPVNVGYSYDDDGSQIDSSDDAAIDVYAFVQLFTGTFEKYGKVDFHVFGESYAGHYIPAIGRTIHEANKALMRSPRKVRPVRLASLGIGNGLTDPLVQFKYYPDMACNNSYHPVLSESQCQAMRDAYPMCKKLINACYKYENRLACVPSTIYCEKQMYGPYQETGLNPYDIRKKCGNNDLCYDVLGYIETYLNDNSVQEKIGVARPYKGCNMAVNQEFLMAGDWMRPYVRDLPPLLEDGIRVLIYAGDADFICNWIGNKAWVKELEWKGHAKFNKAKDLPWHLDGKHVGDYRVAGTLSFVRVFGAGHMVPYDQPAASLAMYSHWLAPEHNTTLFT